MIRRNIRRAFQAVRPPTPQRIVWATDLSCQPAIASLGIGKSVETALALLDLDFGHQTMLIIDCRAGSSPGPRAVHAAATALGRSGEVTLGIPANLSPTETRRWSTLAKAAGANATVLGASGWNRVEFGDRSLVLEHADVPIELHGDATIIAMSAPSGSGCIALWTEIVHPNSALRARVASNAVAELSSAVDARYLLIGQIGALWLAMLATPAIAAELAARGVQRLRERLRGFETPGPWEDAGVQHLSALELSGFAATDLVVRVRLEDNAGEEIARKLTEMLGWRLEYLDN